MDLRALPVSELAMKKKGRSFDSDLRFIPTCAATAAIKLESRYYDSRVASASASVSASESSIAIYLPVCSCIYSYAPKPIEPGKLSWEGIQMN